MRNWLYKHIHVLDPILDKDHWVDQIQFPTAKPPATLTIDDRVICFKGIFPSIEEIQQFKPWNKT